MFKIDHLIDSNSFFLTYCAFEIPSNLLLKRFRPSVSLTRLMLDNLDLMRT
jgi:hypothetical protein